MTAELSGLAMADAEFTVAVAPLTVRGDDSAPLTLPSGATVHAGPTVPTPSSSASRRTAGPTCCR